MADNSRTIINYSYIYCDWKRYDVSSVLRTFTRLCKLQPIQTHPSFVTSAKHGLSMGSEAKNYDEGARMSTATYR